MDRQPIVAGRFYEGRGPALEDDVRRLMGPPVDKDKALLAMVPHAGYVYSGAVCGRTLARAALAPTILLLGPNHTGQGRSMAVWPRGRWFTPTGGLDVDERLADALLAAEPRMTSDTAAHMGEHSLEVVVPFLEQAAPGATIVPVAVSEQRPDVLAEVGKSVARVLSGWDGPVSLVVSSDMSHYIPHDVARQRDALALAAVEALDPMGLYGVVRREGISMCGVLPMTLGLTVAVELGATRVEVVEYATSGDVSGDKSRVVGYAGVLVS